MKKKRNIFRHFFQLVRCLVLAFPLLHVCFNVVKNWVQDTKYDVVTKSDTGEIAVSQNKDWGKDLSNAFVYSLYEESYNINACIEISSTSYDFSFGFFDGYDFNALNANGVSRVISSSEFITAYDICFEIYHFDLVQALFNSTNDIWFDGEDGYVYVKPFSHPFIFTDMNFIIFKSYYYSSAENAFNYETWVFTTWLNYYLNYLISLSVILLLPEFVLWFIDSVRNYGYKLSDKLD